MMTGVYKELTVNEHPYERSTPLQFIMVITFIMTFILLNIDNSVGARLAALMSFAWFLVTFTLYTVTWLLHGHVRWRSSLDNTSQVERDDAE
jgi:hypothetical protein